MFKIGDKVRCIKMRSHYERVINTRNIYTVKRFNKYDSDLMSFFEDKGDSARFSIQDFKLVADKDGIVSEQDYIKWLSGDRK